jgi:hypothetical protein
MKVKEKIPIFVSNAEANSRREVLAITVNACARPEPGHFILFDSLKYFARMAE